MRFLRQKSEQNAARREYELAYASRRIVQPDELGQTINEILDLLGLFIPLGAHVALAPSCDSTDIACMKQEFEKAKVTYDAEFDKFRQAEGSIRSMRLSDSTSQLATLQVGFEFFHTEMLYHFYYDANAYLAMTE